MTSHSPKNSTAISGGYFLKILPPLLVSVAILAVLYTAIDYTTGYGQKRISILAQLLPQWQLEDWSHCMMVPFGALLIVYLDRVRLLLIPRRGAASGLVVVTAGFLLYWFGFKERFYKGVRIIRLRTITMKSLDTILHTLFSVLCLPFLKPDLVYFCGVGNAIFCIPCRWMRIPCIINVDGEDWARKKWGGFASRWLLQSEGWASRFADIVIADARVIQKRYLELYNRETLFIPYGANIREEIPESTILERLGLQRGEYILFVSRLVPENRAELLIEAFKEFPGNMKLVIVGDAPYSEEYKKTLRETADPRVVFAGYVFENDYAAISLQSAFFCLPSGIDGTRPVLLDQMGFGKCILLRNSQANLEVGGDAVAIFEGQNELTSLSSAIRRLCNSREERERLGKAARKRVAELYDWEVITTQYEQLFAGFSDERISAED